MASWLMGSIIVQGGTALYLKGVAIGWCVSFFQTALFALNAGALVFRRVKPRRQVGGDLNIYLQEIAHIQAIHLGKLARDKKRAGRIMVAVYAGWFILPYCCAPTR